MKLQASSWPEKERERERERKGKRYIRYPTSTFENSNGGHSVSTQ
jgi:hypothetical protein